MRGQASISSFDSLRPSPVCWRSALIAAMAEPPATILSISVATDGGSDARTDDGVMAVGVIDERVAVAFDTAARCGAVVLTDQCSMRSFASLRPTPEWSR